MARCLIALGSNLGRRESLLASAIERVARLPGVQLVGQSRLHATAPVGGPPGQPQFLNAAILIQTTLDPWPLAQRLQEIEKVLGRQRAEAWGPRTIDLDLLLYEDAVIQTAQLTVPHPRMAFRRFVIEPAAEVAPGMVHPLIGWTMAQLNHHLATSRAYLAIAAALRQDASRLAEQVAQATGGRLLADPGPGFGHQLAPDAPADTSGRAAGREIEFLTRRGQLLRAEASGSGRLLVSDFWLDQSLAWADALCTDPSKARIHAAWQKASIGAARPKLLVVVSAGQQPAEPDEDPSQPIGQDATDSKQRILAELDAALHRRAGGAGQGPVLWLEQAQREDWLNQTLAAIEAMA